MHENFLGVWPFTIYVVLCCVQKGGRDVKVPSVPCVRDIVVLALALILHNTLILKVLTV